MSDVKDKITKNGRGLLLAYDQGFEHGPTDFDDESVDPANIVKIGREAGVFTGIIFQKGIAEKYYNNAKEEKPPLIVKLNGKTSTDPTSDPYSPPLCTV